MGEVLTALFHKLEIDGKVYYQCRFIVPEFIPNERFDSILERDKSDKSDFYITAPSDKLLTKGIKENAIFSDEGKELIMVKDQRLLTNLKAKFEEEHANKAKEEQTGSHPQELIDAYVKKIEEETKCPKRAIRDIISTVVYNRELNKSSLSTLTKNMHHDNIVMIGPIGNGEDIILDSVEKNLQIPVVRLNVTGDLEEDALTIAHNIEESKKKFNGNALVILDCDFKSLSEEFEGDTFYPVRELITYAGKYTSPYLDRPIRFNELTYLTSINVSKEMAEIENIEAYFSKLTGCTKAIMVNKLSMNQIRNLLYKSSYSVLKYCADTAKKYNREFTVNRQVIADAIKFLDFFDGHIAMLNSAILESFKSQLENGKGKISLGGEILEYIEGVMDLEYPSEEQAPDNNVEEESDVSFDHETASRVDELTKEITKTIRGQDKQVRRIVKYVLKNLEYANNPDVTEPNKRKKNILIRGETGTGKTEIVRRLAKLIGVPIYVADATQYTEEGYVGDSVNEMLLDLYHEAGDDIKKAERGILVIDEIDKKANNHGDRSDISRGAVLQSLLKIVEGTKKKIKYEEALPSGAVVRKKLDFDTNRLTVICLGAFENLEKVREERIRKATKPKGMGFQSDSDQAKARENENKVNRNFISEDYEAYGMGNQFIPRFEGKVYLNSLTKENMVDIMKNSNLSAIKLKKEEYLLDGVILEFTEDFYEKLAVIAVSKKAGARGISEALEDTFETLGLNDLDTTQYQKIILNGECITNPEALVLVPREQQKVKKL